jgi:YD repeat-containing protein
MKKVLFLLLMMGTIASAFAGVNLKNGNFYVTYTDLSAPGGGTPLEITRTYNSKSTDDGWFGFGWGSDFETFLTVSPDGSVMVHENGSGALTRFTPRKKLDPAQAAQKIVQAMKKVKRLSSSAAKNFLDKLTKDAQLRMIYARRYSVKTNLADGTILYSNNRGLQKIKKVKSGYLRQYADGRKEYFDGAGRLKRIVYKGTQKVDIAYMGKKGSNANKVKSITDSMGKQVFFSWYPGSNGKVQSVWTTGKTKVTYKYKGRDLVSAVDNAGNKFFYDYDSNHNLTEVKYKDGSTMKVEYAPKTFFVSSVTDRRGRKTSYKYDSNPKNPQNHYWTEVSRKSISGKNVTNRYEYELKTKPDGEKYTYRVLTVIDGVRTETINSECCGLPIKITRGNVTTNFEYNKDGLLTKKTSTTGERVELSYHPKSKKIVKVRNNQGTTVFKYNRKAELTYAKNSAGKEVKLYYNIDGRIKSMAARDKRNKKEQVLSFVYNAQGKPVQISMKRVGKIKVYYDSFGEIKRVESKQGSKMALQVTRAFQNLLSIVKPAGVSLSL